MQAKKCDRCGRLYEHYDGRKSFPKSLSNSIELRDTDISGQYWGRSRFDLCFSCMVGLESFLYGGTDPVVRCRECNQGEVDDPDFPDEYYCHAGCGWNKGDFYCAYGERKEG